MTRQEIIAILEKENENIDRELNCKILDKYNYVVIGNDFCYTIKEKAHRELIIVVIGGKDDAVRWTKKGAEQAAATIKASNGAGPISWSIMPVRDYLLKLKANNTTTLNYVKSLKETELSTL